MSALRGRGGLTVRHIEPVMGTVVSFDVRPQGLAHERTRHAVDAACRVLHRADDVFSLYRPDTPIQRVRRGELAVGRAPAEVAEVLDLCRRARDLSDGWFDPWAMPGGLDPTGLVKGWAAQRALDCLQDAGVGAAMVNAAGDIGLFGVPREGERWRIGIRSPRAADRLLCVVAAGAAVATSGTYERGEHIDDVRAGGPARAAVSATVTGPELAIADALATGLVAAGRRGLDAIERAGYEALVVDADRTLTHTATFPFAL